MPRSTEVNKQLRDSRREQILLAALRIFTRKGFAAAKMSDIAGEAGVSYGLAYHYFKSKEDVFVELVDHAVNSIGSVIQEVRKTDENPLEQIREIAGRVFSSIDNNEASGYYYVLVMGAITQESVPVPAGKIIERAMEYLKDFVSIISRGQQDGLIRDGDPSCFVEGFRQHFHHAGSRDPDAFILKEPEAVAWIYFQ